MGGFPEVGFGLQKAFEDGVFISNVIDSHQAEVPV